MVHAASGFFGTLMETAFIGAKDCNINNGSLAYILLFNECNWILHEATTVWYSYIKTSVIFTSDTLKKVFMFINGFLLLVFAVLRINIGRLRFSANSLDNDDIQTAHSYAFLVWGAADLIILGLLCYNVWDHVKRRSNKESKGMIMTLMNSSVPRIAIIFFNTLFIVIIGQLKKPLPKTLDNFHSFLWLVKGTYPMILLLDILMTKSMLIAQRDKSAASGKQRSTRRGDIIGGGWGEESTGAGSSEEDPKGSVMLKNITTVAPPPTSMGNGTGSAYSSSAGTAVSASQSYGQQHHSPMSGLWSKERDATPASAYAAKKQAELERQVQGGVWGK
ncbi:hypothetical protein HDU97_008359 [Phlyctochytrium planicorne]|nr:hypothetical protein HDU97_008359 [Phlyctochytrium planicorne]